MEVDRDQTDVGVAVEAELAAEEKTEPRRPKRRFVGRKAAAERNDNISAPNATIEDSGAIQGRAEVFISSYQKMLAKFLYQSLNLDGQHGC